MHIDLQILLRQVSLDGVSRTGVHFFCGRHARVLLASSGDELADDAAVTDRAFN
ncbi:hypothetical protein [Cupriavidus basilensis]|uniref:hypothetical protein n=1 Tax=Cupriavidus basilensis TaxID=68895 RepID=UPI0023E83D62|nr:hypothetical protein [Cupriavidus basilensis]MDF3883135.1 hypothetical protein [Cupriavidus basilensis]